MTDSKTWAKRVVAGWELYLRRAPWETRWEVSLCDRVLNVRSALAEGLLRTATLSADYFTGKTFATPDDAAAYVRQLISC
jgi:hypothetical protein